MRAPENHGGFFTPEDLIEMQHELDSSAPRKETGVERENRALAIVLKRQAHDPTISQKKN
jgi:hypothetical protein